MRFVSLFLLGLAMFVCAVAPTVDREAATLDEEIGSTVRAEVMARQSQAVVRP